MPTNLPIEATRKWSEVASAKNPQQKLQLMHEFLGLVPKHKGTARLCAQVKRQMATLRREMEEKKKKRSGRGTPKFFIEKEGSAQIVIVGPTKVGKSSLLASITNASVEVSSYPYTTREPVPGMFQFEDLQFQIVEAPALMEGSAEGEAWGAQTLGLARNSDGLLLMVDLSQEPCKQLSLILNELEKARILVKKPRAKIEIERKHAGFGLRVVVIGQLLDCYLRDVENLLKNYKITDAMTKIQGEASLYDIEEAIFENSEYRPAIIVANKVDSPQAPQKLKELKGCALVQTKIIPVSCTSNLGLNQLGKEIFDFMGIIRIYTKEPNSREASSRPFTLRGGSTILDLAKQIHSDFYRHLSYARVWSPRLPFSPARVGSSFILKDKDVVELHAK